MAQQLYVSSYAGNISQLSLENSKLTSLALFNGCAPDPTWLTLDKSAHALYCLGESANDLKANGSVTSYSVCPASGKLTQQSKQQTINGPVSSILYPNANGSKALALAHYGGSAVSTFSIGNDLALSPLQQIPIDFPNAPGPNADRQTAAHAHEALVDPTGKYVLAPDLGKDLVHVFSHDPNTGILKELDPLKAAPGSGPRHAAFWSPKQGQLFFYLVAELAATLTGYEVEYKSNDGGLLFKELFVNNTLGGKKPERVVAPAEIAVSPDQRFLVVSNRNDSSFTLPNPDPSNSTKIPSDSLASYQLQSDGSLKFMQLAAVGGRFPRQFQINSKGDKIAAVLQNDNRVAILGRDIQNGTIGPVEASANVPDQPTCVVWA